MKKRKENDNSLFSVSIKFLFDIADVVDRLVVSIKESDSNIHLQLVKEILSRKCFALEINNWWSYFTVNDITNLVAVSHILFFNNYSEKNISSSSIIARRRWPSKHELIFLKK